MPTTAPAMPTAAPRRPIKAPIRPPTNPIICDELIAAIIDLPFCLLLSDTLHPTKQICNHTRQCCLTKKAEPQPNRDVVNPRLLRRTDSANGCWLRRLVRPQRCHSSNNLSRINPLPLADALLGQNTNQLKSNYSNHRQADQPSKSLNRSCGLTKKAEPPPTRDVNRDSGTDSANGGWLRRLVRRLAVVIPFFRHGHK